MRRILSMLTLFSMLLCTLSPFAAAATATLQVGDPMPDFTATTYTGETVTLSEVLESKQMVLINLWATWCGPCRSEFPYMEEAYRQYQDQIEIIALSTEPTDTAEKLKEFCETYGLTFPVGQDTPNLATQFGVTGIPTSIVVDRYGTICYVASGAMPDTASFIRLFDAFVGDEYSSSLLLNGLPPVKPTIAASPADDVRDALGVEARTPANAYIWPMTVVEKDGRQVVAASNANVDDSTAALEASLTAQPGDAIVITFKTATEPVFALMEISVNGSTIKCFSGDHDWMTYAIPVTEAGEQQLTISYTKNGSTSVAEDGVWIDSIELLSGAAAEEAIARNPQYPQSEATSLLIDMPQAREIRIEDPYGLLYANFGNAKYYIINQDVATFRAEISADVDPEAAFFYTNYDGSITPLTQTVGEGAYHINTPVDSLQSTGYSFTTLWLYPDLTGVGAQCVLYFLDDSNVDHFVSVNQLGEWTYAEDASLTAGDRATTLQVNDQAEYTLKCVDQSGTPVAGVMLQVCDDETCQVFTTDANGIASFTSVPKAWEIHILKAPEDYAVVTTDTVIAPLTGGELVFQLTKN